jgi:hypothetical protein
MRIYSYFSLPTDLAAAMRDWPEFVCGEEYSVELKDETTGEEVMIELGRDDGAPYLLVKGDRSGLLYEKAVGRTIIELQPHTDNLMIENMD